jgi:twitching motility protein PilT
MGIQELLRTAVERQASDLHLRVGSVPTLRIYGDLVPMEGIAALKPRDVERCFEEITTIERRKLFAEHHELDFEYSIKDFTRCRVNVMQQRSTLSIAIRIIPYKIPSLEELKLPPVIRELAMKRSGLILITGAKGMGKSTTIAAMVEYLNCNARRNIVTIEDPIEYIYKNKKCLIVQRNVGHDTESFDVALVHALRHDPDVIVVGEIREIRTLQTALRAAETGHLVMGTMHTVDAAQTINRILDMFPDRQHEQVRNELSQILVAVICEFLIPCKGDSGMIPACEIMLSNNAIRNTIREGRIHQLYGQIQVFHKEGMQTLNQALAELMQNGLITEEQAYNTTSMSEELKSLLHSSRKNSQTSKAVVA